MISTDDGIKIVDGGNTSFKPFAAESNHKDDDANAMDIHNTSSICTGFFTTTKREVRCRTI